MSPREVITAFAKREISNSHPFTPEELADAILAKLKAEGLFIGPLVPTPEMQIAARRKAKYLFEHNIDLSDAEVLWTEMATEWQRTEDA